MAAFLILSSVVTKVAHNAVEKSEIKVYFINIWQLFQLSSTVCLCAQHIHFYLFSVCACLICSVKTFILANIGAGAGYVNYLFICYMCQLIYYLLY